MKSSPWVVLGALLFSCGGWANGYVTVSPVQEYGFRLTNQNIDNKTGAISGPHELIDADNYDGTVTCPDMSISNANAKHYYKTTFSNMLGITADKFVAINDYLELKVEVFIGGNINQYFPAPFENVDNNYINPGHKCTKGGSLKVQNYATGSKVRVTFRVRKPIINGVQIQDRQLVELFGRLGNTVTTFGPNPMARIAITSSLLYVPEKCVINGGATVQVEFGDLPQRNLDGNQFAKQAAFPVRCYGGIFDTAVPLKINLALSGKGAAFSQSDLRTTRDSYKGSQVSPDLAIRFKQLNGQPLLLNTFYPVAMQGDRGEWGFIAAPLQAAGSEVAPGDFYATATVVAEFQ